MGECRNWQTGPTQNRLTAGSIPALPTILIIILLSFFAICQEEEPPKDPPLIPPVDEMRVMRREKLQAVMGSVLLERYLQTYDEWCKNGGFVKAHIHGENDFNSENWFALVVRNDIDEPLWIKFCLYRTYEKHDLGVAQSNGTINAQITILRKGLKASLEQTIIENLDNEEVRQSIIYGEAHIYQLITKDSDISKLRKEDRIF